MCPFIYFVNFSDKTVKQKKAVKLKTTTTTNKYTQTHTHARAIFTFLSHARFVYVMTVLKKITKTHPIKRKKKSTLRKINNPQFL